MGKSLKRLTEDEARTLLEGIRWPEGPICPHCSEQKVVEVKGGRKGLKRCKACRKQFTVTVGTIFERSHIPLHDWIYAFDAMCASKKGVSALQLSRELGCQYKTAWFMCHRIREAMKSDCGILGTGGGHVEADETFVGGKPRKGQERKGRWSVKVPVVALVERDGNVHTRVVPNVDSRNLRRELRRTVDRSATLHTDEHRGYIQPGLWFAQHLTVNHSQAEYFRHADGAGIQTAESFFALIKRGVYGNFHHVSRKHLFRYCNEFEFRWNTRKLEDGDRVVQALSQVSGKRLTYYAAGQHTHPKNQKAKSELRAKNSGAFQNLQP